MNEPAGAASSTVGIDAEAGILPKIFPGAFDFTISLAKQGSWTIDSIAGSYSGGVALADIVNGLLGGGRSAPAAFAAIVFSDFGVSVTGSAGARTYTIYGAADVAVPW